MNIATKKYVFSVLALFLTVFPAVNTAHAQADNQTIEALSEEELDRVLAPIALYPDTLLTHILIASTYPMDVIRAQRWREKNSTIDGERALRETQNFDWDPSVKALIPFNDVLEKMANDLDWLNYLGDSVIADEEWVLSRIQVLRDNAYANGALSNNDYVNVEREDDVIVIETVREKVVYVPFYDTRVVYGNWWHARSPYYWHHPRHYSLRSGFYWSPRIHISSGFFFGGFHWNNGYVVINHNNFYGRKRLHVGQYTRWSHNTHHRQARYHTRVNHHRSNRIHKQRVVVRDSTKGRVSHNRHSTYVQPVSVAKPVRQISRTSTSVKQTTAAKQRRFTTPIARTPARSRNDVAVRNDARVRPNVVQANRNKAVQPNVQKAVRTSQPKQIRSKSVANTRQIERVNKTSPRNTNKNRKQH